jgi:hypothetical protein
LNAGLIVGPAVYLLWEGNQAALNENVEPFGNIEVEDSAGCA